MTRVMHGHPDTLLFLKLNFKMTVILLIVSAKLIMRMPIWLYRAVGQVISVCIPRVQCDINHIYVCYLFSASISL